MDIRELKGLCEAYEQVYIDQQFSDEVEIATEYFYSEGLNEYGIDILIEELGVDEFVDFVQDIVEEYTITEARAGGVRIEPVTKGGKPVGSLKGGAKTAAINRLRKEKTARKEAEAKASSSKPSGMTAALRSQSVKSAAAKQPAAKPTKQGIGAKIGAALKYAGERAKQDTAKVARAAGTAAGVVHGAAKVAHRAGQEFGKSKAGQQLKAGLGKTAKAAVGAAGAGAGSLAAGKSPAAAAGRAAGTFVRKLTKEEFDSIASYLLDEGYVENVNAAEAIVMSISEEWKNEIIEARRSEKEGKGSPEYRTASGQLVGQRGEKKRLGAMGGRHFWSGGEGGSQMERGKKKVKGAKSDENKYTQHGRTAVFQGRKETGGKYSRMQSVKRGSEMGSRFD